MTPPELEYAARRYIAPRLTLLPLSCGRVAVGEGFNPPDLLHIAEDWHDAAEWLAGYCEAHLAEGEVAREASARAHRAKHIPEIELNLNLDNLELF